MESLFGTAPLFNSELPNGMEAAVWLAGRVRALTPRGAAEFLELGRDEYDESVASALYIARLYEEVFPDKYLHSARPPYSSEMQFEFYHLIDQHKFPMDLRPLYTHANFVYEHIPIKCVQAHDWIVGCGHRFEQLELVFQVVIALCNTWLQQDWWPTFARMYEFSLEERPASWEDVSIEAFTQRCLEEPPFQLLPIVFMVVAYNSGNLFLDSHPMNPTARALQTRFEWNKENIETLAAHWKKAKRMLSDIAGLNEWIGQSPVERMHRAVALWNQTA